MGAWQIELQKINRVHSFKGSRHRLFIVPANYQRKIITADGSGVTDFSYTRLWAEQMKKRELSHKAKHLTEKELHSPDGDLLSLSVISLMWQDRLTAAFQELIRYDA